MFNYNLLKEGLSVVWLVTIPAHTEFILVKLLSLTKLNRTELAEFGLVGL